MWRCFWNRYNPTPHNWSISRQKREEICFEHHVFLQIYVSLGWQLHCHDHINSHDEIHVKLPEMQRCSCRLWCWNMFFLGVTKKNILHHNSQLKRCHWISSTLKLALVQMSFLSGAKGLQVRTVNLWGCVNSGVPVIYGAIPLINGRKSMDNWGYKLSDL